MKKILLSLVNCCRKIEKFFEDCFHKETGKMEEQTGLPDYSPFMPEASSLYFHVKPPIEKCFMDNRVFRYFREFVYRLDNRLFNRNTLDPNYQPTRYALILPYYTAWLAVVYVFIIMLFMDIKQEIALERVFFLALPMLVLVNVLFSLKHLLSLSK